MAVEPRRMAYGDQSQPHKEAAGSIPQKSATSGANCSPHDGISASVQSSLNAETNGRQAGGSKASPNSNSKGEKMAGSSRQHPRSALYSIPSASDGSFDPSSALSAALDVRRKRRRLLRSIGTRSVRKLANVLDETFRLALTARSPTDELVAKLFANLASRHLKTDMNGSSALGSSWKHDSADEKNLAGSFASTTKAAGSTSTEDDNRGVNKSTVDGGSNKSEVSSTENEREKGTEDVDGTEKESSSAAEDLSQFWQNVCSEPDNSAAEKHSSIICRALLKEFERGPVSDEGDLVTKVTEAVQPELNNAENGKEGVNPENIATWVRSIYKKLKGCGVFYVYAPEVLEGNSNEPTDKFGKQENGDLRYGNRESPCSSQALHVDINRLLALLPAMKIHSEDAQQLVRNAPTLGYYHSSGVRQFYLEHLGSNYTDKGGDSDILVMTIATTAAVASLQESDTRNQKQDIKDEGIKDEEEPSFVEQWKRRISRGTQHIESVATTIYRLLCPNEAIVSPLNSHVYAPEVSQNSTNLPSLTVLAAIITEARRRYDNAIDKAVENCSHDQTIDKLLDAGWEPDSLCDIVSKYYSGDHSNDHPPIANDNMPREKTKKNRMEIARAFVSSVIPRFDPLQVIRDAAGDSDSPVATGDALCGAYVCGSGAAAALKAPPELHTQATSLKELVDCFQPVQSSKKHHRESQQSGQWSPSTGSPSPMTPTRQDSISSLNSFGTPTREDEDEHWKDTIPRLQSFGGTSSASSAEEAEGENSSLLERESTWLGITGRPPLRLLPVASETPWERMTHDQRLHHLLATGGVKLNQEPKASAQAKDSGQQSSVMVALKPYAPQDNSSGKQQELSFSNFGWSSEAGKGTPLSPQSSSCSVSSRFSDSAASAWEAYIQSSVHTPQFVDLGTAVIDGTVDKGTKIWEKYGAVQGYGYGSGSNWRRPETSWDRFDNEGSKEVKQNEKEDNIAEDSPIDRSAPEYVDLGGYKCSEAADGDTTDSSIEDISDLHYEKVHEEIHRKIRERMSSVSSQHKKNSGGHGRGHNRPPPRRSQKRKRRQPSKDLSSIQESNGETAETNEESTKAQRVASGSE